MLEQLNLMTEHMAEAVVTKQPTLRSLFEAYEREQDPRRRDSLLQDATVCSIYLYNGQFFNRWNIRSSTTRMDPSQGGF